MEITTEELMMFKDQILDGFEKLEKMIEGLTTINGKQMLDNKDLRMLLKVCDRTLIRWRQTKKLKGFKIGSKVYFMAADVNEFVRSEYYLQTQKAQQPIKNLDYERIQKKQ